MGQHELTTKELTGARVYGGKKGKRIGKVRRFVFHPTEKRVIGFTVKRPDAALMFHRKDLFVALGGYDVNDEGQIVVRDDSSATDNGAVKALGVDWDACVIWVGMPAITESGDLLGYVDVVTFDAETGAVKGFTTENGAANDAILGKRFVPAKLIKGFRRGQGIALAPMGEYNGENPEEAAETGAILVADAVLDIAAQGGAAAAAGKATAVVADKAKKGTAKAKATVDERMERAKPTAQKVAKRTGEAVEAGTFAVGKQIGRASGMFAAFKEEFDKASRGEE